MNNNFVREIVTRAADLHVHIGPEIIPRKFDLAGLVAREEGKLGAIGVKNHFFPTVAMNRLDSPLTSRLRIINSIVLNSYVGGMNASAVRSSAQLSSDPIIVWFPTIHAKKFLAEQEYEIPLEWIDVKYRDSIRLSLAENIQPINVVNDDFALTIEARDVLLAIKESDAILATGHLSSSESLALVETAVGKFEIGRIIITHPIYQKINMPLSMQGRLAEMGAFIEHCYSMYTIDKVSIENIVEQIKYIGSSRCILSSDVGQTFSKDPSEAMCDFAFLLLKHGLNRCDLEVMMITNPSALFCK